jgi:myo-inositol 2-dehydrogenase / D-chiro-inositol 1-dehydrogenase
MRLITGQEAKVSKIRTIAQRGLNYHDEPPVLVHHSDTSGTDSSDDEPSFLETDDDEDDGFVPIIDSAYVTLPFQSEDKVKTMGCLELCMYADGSRHQEEIIVTGTKGRLEAYLPENKVYSFQRPTNDTWTNKSVPPPYDSIIRNVYDCSDVCEVHGIEKNESDANTETNASTSPIPTHGGYHYSSTAVEWYRLLEGIHNHKQTGEWKPLVSLQDGLRAVEIGLHATESIVNIDD